MFPRYFDRSWSFHEFRGIMEFPCFFGESWRFHKFRGIMEFPRFLRNHGVSTLCEKSWCFHAYFLDMLPILARGI